MFGYQESKYNVENRFEKEKDNKILKLEIRKKVKEELQDSKFRDYVIKKFGKFEEDNNKNYYIAYMVYDNNKLIEDILIMYENNIEKKDIIEDFEYLKLKDFEINKLKCNSWIVQHHIEYGRSGSITMY